VSISEKHSLALKKKQGRFQELSAALSSLEKNEEAGRVDVEKGKKIEALKRRLDILAPKL